MDSTATAMPPPPSGSATGSAGDEGMRRRPVPVNYDWRIEPAAEGEDDDHDDDVVFEDEQPTKAQEYFNIFCDYIFWILLAYCAANLLLWIGEVAGLVSPQFEEWSPVRWFHHNPHELQKDLYRNATQNALTVAQFEGLKKWIEGGPGGWVSPKLLVSDYLSERGRYDRRLEVTEAVERDEVLVKLPLSHVLSSDFCQQDLTDSTIRQVVDAQKKSSEKVEISPWTWITLYMIAHSRKNNEVPPSSTEDWRFDSLLRNEYIDAALSYIPLFWNDEDQSWLNGTDLLNVHVLDVHAAIEAEYHKLSYLVPSIEGTIEIIDFKKWAMVVMSRGETVELPDRENKTRTVPQLAIMPLIDLVDHHLPMPERPLVSDDDLQKYQETGSHTNISYSTELAAVVLRAKEPLTAKAGVTAGYGVRSNSDYLLYHGFTMSRGWSDMTLCTQYSMIELPLPADLPSWKTRFLPHAYRFAVPACPNKKSTPHVVVGAARFMVASETDVSSFQERLETNPGLLESEYKPQDGKFLGHSAREALSVVCDTKAQPPVCKSVISLDSEKASWEIIRKQTVARLLQHAVSIVEDNRLLAEDETSGAGTLTVNQRHATIARREEKLSLRRWCAVAVRIENFLRSAGAEDFEMTRVPDDVVLENEEPRLRPKYWSRLLDPVEEADIPAICQPR